MKLLKSLVVLGFGLASIIGHAQTEVRDKNLLYYIHTVGKPAPTVMLGHGCAGISKAKTRDYVNNIKSWGYNVVVVDSWTPRGVKMTCKGTQPWYSPADRMTEFYEIAERIKQEPWHQGKFGYLGWSHGGSLGLNLAADGRGVFAAIVSYYPNCSYNMAPRRQLKENILVHFGGQDSWTPMRECNDVKGITKKMVHPNATHSFDANQETRVFMGEKLEYDSEAALEALLASKRFFDQYLK